MNRVIDPHIHLQQKSRLTLSKKKKLSDTGFLFPLTQILSATLLLCTEPTALQSVPKEDKGYCAIRSTALWIALETGLCQWESCQNRQPWGCMPACLHWLPQHALITIWAWGQEPKVLCSAVAGREGFLLGGSAALGWLRRTWEVSKCSCWRITSWNKLLPRLICRWREHSNSKLEEMQDSNYYWIKVISLVLLFVFPLCISTAQHEAQKKFCKNKNTSQVCQIKKINCFEELPLRGRKQKTTTNKNNQTRQCLDIKLKCSTQLKSHLLPSTTSVPCATACSYSCNTQYQMFAWGFWLHPNQRCSALGKILLGSVFN